MKLLDSMRNIILLDRNLQDNKIDDVPSSVTPTEIIASTFLNYGSAFVVCFALFILLRLKYPLTYTYNSRVVNQMTPLSQKRFGPVNWMYHIFTYSDNEIYTHCGMAAIVYLRFLRLGFKISCVGIFNSFYLIPANLLGCHDDGHECNSLTDKVEKLSFSHVSDGSANIWATTISAYVIFGSALYLIFKEFEWYTEHRHNFCIKPRPDNYTIYVSHIPKEYRSDINLLRYFQSIFSEEDVLDAKVALTLESLEKKVIKRKQLVENLEHAVNIRDVKGQNVPLIPTYASELNELNEEISSAIDKIERGEEEETATTTVQETAEESSTNLGSTEDDSLLRNSGEVTGGSKKGLSILTQIGSKTYGKMKDTAGTSVSLAKTLISSSEDGKVRDAGFVTFSKLLAKNQAQQIVHHATPFTFYSMAAPQPNDIIWDNVGLPHKQQQISYLLAQLGTVTTCLFWTIPVSFCASLSEVESLKELIPGLDKVLVKNPWLGSFLANLSPLMLVILTSVLPLILTVFCKREGHVSTATLNASLLTKLSSFMIVQIFFVQAISGSITAALNDIIKDWTRIVNLMATSIPIQVKAFIQYVQVKNFLGCSIEILRVVRVVMAFLRNRLGPNLTETERNKPWMGILPMSETEEVQYPMRFAEMILFFMINLIYSCIAPIMSYILLVCFGILSLVFRHQLIYTYSRKNDDGGALWSSAIMLLIPCMVVSEITLIGIIFLKKAFIPGVALVPLIVGTFLFTSYIKQQHFRIIEHVPSTLCSKTDKENIGALDLSFLKDQYLQSAMKENFEFPENMQRSEVEDYRTNDNQVQVPNNLTV